MVVVSSSIITEEEAALVEKLNVKLKQSMKSCREKNLKLINHNAHFRAKSLTLTTLKCP